MIKFTRGDTYRFKFHRKDANGKIIFQKAENICFVSKRNDYTKEILIQKTLGNGITYTEDDGYYHVKIEPADTQNFRNVDCGFYIEVNNQGDVITIKKGKMEIENKIPI